MYGKRVHKARLEFVRRTNHDFWTEATSHRVTSKFDEGAILKIKRVPIFPDDTAEILQARMLPIEHEVQIEILKDFLEGKVKEFYRDLPLIRKKEKNILEESKELAKKIEELEERADALRIERNDLITEIRELKRSQLKELTPALIKKLKEKMHPSSDEDDTL